MAEARPEHEDARFYACRRTIALPGDRPAAPYFRLYYAESWEAPCDFVPQLHVDTSAVHERWVEAGAAYEIFRPGGATFRDQDDYRALSVCRGALVGCAHAAAGADPGQRRAAAMSAVDGRIGGGYNR